MQKIQEITSLKWFDEKYIDKNTPSGLNQTDFKSFPDLVKNIRKAIHSKMLELLREIEGEIEKRKHNPDYTCGEGVMCERNLAIQEIKGLIEKIIINK